MPLRFKKRLLSHLRDIAPAKADIRQLAEDLGVSKVEFDEFQQAVLEMADSGEVVYGDNRFVTLPPLGEWVTGTFKKNPRGFGFIIPTEVTAHGDLFVPATATGDAVTGDTVKARVKRSRRPAREGQSPFVGEIVEVLERARTTFTGELRKTGGEWMVFPDGNVIREPIVVRDAESKNARAGLKVAVQIVHYPEGDYLAEGVITRVLGEAGLPSVETQAVIEAHGLPGEFPDKCVEEAGALTREFEEEIERAERDGGFERSERHDLRETYICTIDPPDAKDYDDAISIERVTLKNGDDGWRLGVHIADVSHFVTPGSALDDEAKDRCNSVYLPRLVIPMLPEVLSNGICSLQEGVDRFCKSAFMDYDDRGRVRGTGFASTVIRSAKRLTYIEAQALIDGDVEKARKHAKTEPEYTEDLRHALREMNALSKRIRQRRREAGMIHLELPEVELVFDDEGRVVDAVPEDDSYTHTLIEMFMVEANEAVARLFADVEVPVLRRVHPEPVPGAMDNLRDFVRVAGYKIPKAPSREELQGLLDATAGTPAGPAVHFAVLRTLTRAEYSPAMIGHFALASGAYSHFTSPIRRYPDLTAHRALAEYLGRTANGQKRPKGDDEKRRLGKHMRESDGCPDEPRLVEIGRTCNLREDRAEAAERELRQFLVLQLLENHVGEDFPGLVTGVTNAGVFVQLEKYLAEGLCRTEDLPVPQTKGHSRFGSWRIDQRSGALVESNSGRSFNIGDRVTVRVAEVDLSRRQMELVITDAATRDVGKPKKLADRLTIGVVEEARPQKTGAQRRAQKSKSRDKGKSDHRKDRKGKGKRQ